MKARTHQGAGTLATWTLAAWALASCGSQAELEKARSESTSPESQPTDWFSEEAAARGLVFSHTSGHQKTYLMPEIMGGGAALFDMDQDGDLDAYLVQSGSLYLDASPSGSNRLFENIGDGQFKDITERSGAGHSGYGMGVACGDVNGDGDIDLYVTNMGPNVLLMNDGTGHFVDSTELSAVGDPSWSTSAAFFDLENDGDLDLYVCNYLDWQLANELPCRNQMGSPDYCSPLNYKSPAPDKVFLNQGDGTFIDWSAEFGTSQNPSTGLGVVCADFDGDGRLEVFVANDGMPNFLWAPTASGWEEVARARGCALDGEGLAKAGMGVDVEDLDGDGDPDLLVCNLRLQSDSFYRNEGLLFRDQTVASGLGVASRTFTRFGLGLVDFDNDGHLDLYEANGRVMRQGHLFSQDPYAEPNMLFRGSAEGRFAVVSPQGGLSEQQPFNSRAAAFGDIDNDGGMDVLVINIDGPVQLFRNVCADRGAWVSFSLIQSGQLAMHARVGLDLGSRQEYRYARAAASYQASNDPRVHFGLGLETTARAVTVTWPDGTVEAFGDLPANQHHVLHRGAR